MDHGELPKPRGCAYTHCTSRGPFFMVMEGDLAYPSCEGHWVASGSRKMTAEDWDGWSDRMKDSGARIKRRLDPEDV